MENNITVSTSKAEDVQKLYKILRKDDLDEIKALGSLPLNSLLDGYLFSDECYSIFVNNDIIGMFGFNKQIHAIWFLGSEVCSLFPKEWIKLARYYIKHFLDISPILANTISTNNKLHINWLKRMGAVFSAPYLINNTFFQDFYIIKGE